MERLILGKRWIKGWIEGAQGQARAFWITPSAGLFLSITAKEGIIKYVRLVYKVRKIDASFHCYEQRTNNDSRQDSRSLGNQAGRHVGVRSPGRSCDHPRASRHTLTQGRAREQEG